MFAILAVWTALGALITTIALIAMPDRSAEIVLTLLPYTIALSATLAAAVLWALRKRPPTETGVPGQRAQALTSLLLNSLNFAILLFTLNDPKYAILGLFIEFGFLWLCYLGYTRILVPDKK
jgi:hypothetical protein